MIFKHKRTGVLYRHLGWTYDVASQREHVLYVSLENGCVFNRDKDIFEQNFELIDGDPHASLVPHSKVEILPSEDYGDRGD